MNQVEALMPIEGRVEHDYNSKYAVEVTTLDHGIVIRVGCKVFAFEDIERGIKYMNEYLRDPQETTKKFYDNTLFN